MNNKLVGVFLVLMGGISLSGSVPELIQGVQTKSATPISFAAFTHDLPEAGWFKVSGAQLDMTGALYVDEGGGKVGNIYVPARKAGSELDPDSKAPIEVLVRVSDAQSRQFVEKLNAIPEKDTMQALQFLEKNSDKLQVQRPIEGTLAEGLDALDDRDKSAIERSDAQLAPDFVILQEGVTPSIGGRVFMLLFSAAIALGGLVMIFKKG